MNDTNNYTIGRGKLYFQPEGTNGFLYFGNSPSMSATIEDQSYDHYSSDGGVKEKDFSISLQTNRTGQFSCDNVSTQNLSFFFFGKVNKLTVAAQQGVNETFAKVTQGRYLPLGIADDRPTGYRNVSNVTVKNAAGATTYAEGTDYEVESVLGRIKIIVGGTIQDESDIKVTYDVGASTREQTISGSTPIKGSMHYVADNPAGKNFDWLIPNAVIKPNGEFALKSDEAQVMNFNFEMLKVAPKEALYIDGRPA